MSGPFRWLSPVYFDELDLNGTLHNTRFAVHVERAQSALFEQLGRGWTSYADRDPDLRYVVRELHVEFLAPLESPGSLLVELSAGKLGRTSAQRSASAATNTSPAAPNARRTARGAPEPRASRARPARLTRSDASAAFAVRLAERTEENVATASTSVPAAVASDDTVTQSSAML